MQKSSLPYSTTIYSVQLQLYIQNLLNFDSVACLLLLSFSARWKGGKERILRCFLACQRPARERKAGHQRRGEREGERAVLKAEVGERKRRTKLALIGEWLAILHYEAELQLLAESTFSFFLFIALWGLSCREEGNRFDPPRSGDTLASSVSIILIIVGVNIVGGREGEETEVFVINGDIRNSLDSSWLIFFRSWREVV